MDDFLIQQQCEDFEPLIEEYCGIASPNYPLDYDCYIFVDRKEKEYA